MLLEGHARSPEERGNHNCRNAHSASPLPRSHLQTSLGRLSKSCLAQRRVPRAPARALGLRLRPSITNFVLALRVPENQHKLGPRRLHLSMMYKLHVSRGG